MKRRKREQQVQRPSGWNYLLGNPKESQRGWGLMGKGRGHDLEMEKHLGNPAHIGHVGQVKGFGFDSKGHWEFTGKTERVFQAGEQHRAKAPRGQVGGTQ